MKAYIRAWYVGVEISHYLLFLISFIYNINTGMRRYNKNNFRHLYFYIIGCIQIRVQEIYNVFVQKNDTNILLYKAIKKIKSIRVGELNYHNIFVEKGE